MDGPGTDRIMVFQDFNQLFPWKTVKKNIQYPLKISGIKDKEKLEQIAQEHLELVGLGDKGDLYPHQLSGGMKPVSYTHLSHVTLRERRRYPAMAA